MSPHTLRNRIKLRRDIRAKRRALTPQEQRQHSRAMTTLLCNSTLYRNSSRIAIYQQNDGEIDPSLLAAAVNRHKKKCYLPVLRPRFQHGLWFSELHSNERLQPNRFGIDEPYLHGHRIAPPWALDLILLPLVAFDENGNRLGMGGGFYDRTLAYLKLRKKWRKPKLIGLAHELQNIKLLQNNRWDIPIDGVVTEKEFYYYKKK